MINHLILPCSGRPGLTLTLQQPQISYGVIRAIQPRGAPLGPISTPWRVLPSQMLVGSFASNNCDLPP